MAVGLVAGKPRGHVLEGKFRQQRDPVEGLLPVHCNIVAERFEGFAREGIIHAFGLLQADDVGPPLREPRGHVVDPLLDGIDVPGGDAHDGRRWVWCGATSTQRDARDMAPRRGGRLEGYAVFTTVSHWGYVRSFVSHNKKNR